MQQVISDVLARRRDRGLAVILAFKDRECDEYLPKDVSARLRKTILDQYNEFYDFAMDIMRSLDNGEYVVNEHYVERMERMLSDIHQHVTAGSNGQ